MSRDNQQARETVLRFLAERPSLTFDVPTIWQRVNASHWIDRALTPIEVEHALAFLLDAEFIKLMPSALGATPFYRVTHAGILQHERSL